MKKHTPGPWKSTESPHATPGSVFLINNPDGAIGEVRRNEADARLIAAAPDLLAAAEAAVQILVYGFVDPQEAVDLLERAIAKAEGRS